MQYPSLLLMTLIAAAVFVAGFPAAAFPVFCIRFLRRLRRKLYLRWTKKPDKQVRFWHRELTRLVGIVLIVPALWWLVRFDPQPALTPEFPGTPTLAVSEIVHSEHPASIKDQRSLSDIITPLVRKHHFGGMVIGVISGNAQTVLGYGSKSVRDTTAPDGNTLFEIASMTKTFTSIALARMVDANEVSLDEPVEALLPDAPRVPEFEGKKITLVDLATHTSGLPRLPGNLTSRFQIYSLEYLYNPYGSYTVKDAYRFLSRYQLKRAPGAAYEYSNFGAGLLGYALSRKKGVTYEQLIKSLICEPLGMADTVITRSPEQKKRTAQAYLEFHAYGPCCLAFPTPGWQFHECFQGAGALWSTINDVLKYMAANMGIVKTDFDAAIQQTHVARHKINARMRIGLGWHILEGNQVKGRVIWHNGATGGYRSYLGFVEGEPLGVVILSNSIPVDNMGLEILKALQRQIGTAHPQ